MDEQKTARLSVRIPDELAKELKKHLIDLNLSFQEWTMQKIEKELAKA